MNKSSRQIWLLLKGYINQICKDKEIDFAEFANNFEQHRSLSMIDDIIILVQKYSKIRPFSVEYDKFDKLTTITKNGMEVFEVNSEAEELLVCILSSIIYSELSK